jgi:lipoprotein-anchoring transpeptidase ErfK/SrfK
VPNVEIAPQKGEPVSGPRVARIEVSKGGEFVHALGESGAIVYHFPTTLGSMYDPSPDGDWKVTGVQYDPPFRYDPTLFSDVPDSKPKAKLPPGPNSPVGVVWVQLSRNHVGIHGTADPELVGYAQSHGCVRLTNWDALKVASLVRPGTRVVFAE